MTAVRHAAFAALVAAVLSAPASAAGADIAVDQECYAETVGTVTITGSGYTPSSTASVTLGGTTAGVDTDVNGAFVTTLTAPSTTLKHPGAQQLTLTGTDDTTGAAATTAVNIARTGVDGVPSRSRPHKRITWNIAGFPGTKPIYGHWRIRGKTRADHRMGVPQGPCGVLHAKARQIEANQILFGLWTVQFDFNRHYDKHATPRATVQITVSRTFS
jgi:hypothetical protein